MHSAGANQLQKVAYARPPRGKDVLGDIDAWTQSGLGHQAHREIRPTKRMFR